MVHGILQHCSLAYDCSNEKEKILVNQNLILYRKIPVPRFMCSHGHMSEDCWKNKVPQIITIKIEGFETINQLFKIVLYPLTGRWYFSTGRGLWLTLNVKLMCQQSMWRMWKGNIIQMRWKQTQDAKRYYLISTAG